MPRRAIILLRSSLAAATLFLAACGGGPDDEELAKLDNQILANEADPAVASALADQIMVDPSLSQQSNRLAARRAPGPVQAQYPQTDGADAGGGGCGAAQLDEGLDWANRLPAAFAIYPSGQVTEAAGTDGSCRVRVVSFTTSDSAERVIGWYEARAERAGFSAERQIRDGDRVLAGTSGDAAYFLIVTPKRGGSDVSLVANQGR